MTWLAAAVLLGVLAGWCAARSLTGPPATVLSVAVLAMALGIVPLGRLGRRVVARRRD